MTSTAAPAAFRNLQRGRQGDELPGDYRFVSKNAIEEGQKTYKTIGLSSES